MNPFLHYVLEAGVCLAFFYSIYWLFLKKETYFHLNRAYLVSSLLLSFIIPALNISSPFFTIRDAAEGVRLPQTPSLTPDRPIDITAILLVVYAAGVLLLLARLVFHLANLAGVVRRSDIWSCDGLKIVSIEKDFSPFSFLHFVFINSRNLTEVNLRHILAHEEVHIRQCHSLDILLIELVTIMQWFNPFVRPYKKALQETHEYLADFGVIAQGFSTAKYQLLMFEQHVGAKLFEFANNFKQSQIKRRITMMSKIKSRNVAKLKLLLVLPLALFLALAFGSPRPAKTADHTPVPALQEKTAPSQEDSAKKEKIIQAEDELKMLKDNEKKLRTKLASVEDAETKKELEMNLQQVLAKEEAIVSFLQKSGTDPAPGQKKLADEYKMLQQKEMQIREELAKTDDPGKKAELKGSLVKVLEKQDQVKSQVEKSSASEEETIVDLKKDYTMLQQKEKDIRAQLQKTEDPQEKAKLKSLLADVLKKQEMIKAKAEAMRLAAEKKKT
jgi:beta-lactamase regulating signal transducer with metallopeptidase domain